MSLSAIVGYRVGMTMITGQCSLKTFNEESNGRKVALSNYPVNIRNTSSACLFGTILILNYFRSFFNLCSEM